jgi:hypothetical protein
MTKFDDVDRDKTIDELEKYLGIKLNKVKNTQRRKYLEDGSGRRYCIFGGEEWHGIPHDVIEAEIDRPDSVIVFARKVTGRIDVYIGEFNTIIKNRDLLTLTKAQYQFDLKVSGDLASVKKISNCHLKKLFSFPYLIEDKTHQKTIKDVKTILGKMSPDQLASLSKKLSAKNET